jgi:hypothetical protein
MMCLADEFRLAFVGSSVYVHRTVSSPNICVEETHSHIHDA